jgi:hypothetical protein
MARTLPQQLRSELAPAGARRRNFESADGVGQHRRSELVAQRVVLERDEGFGSSSTSHGYAAVTAVAASISRGSSARKWRGLDGDGVQAHGANHLFGGGMMILLADRSRDRKSNREIANLVAAAA